MRTRASHHSAGLVAVVGIAVVLPLSAAGGGILPAVDDTTSQAATATSTTDAGEIWGVMRTMPARDVAVLHASLTPEIRDDLAAIVHASADAMSADG